MNQLINPFSEINQCRGTWTFSCHKFQHFRTKQFTTTLVLSVNVNPIRCHRFPITTYPSCCDDDTRRRALLFDTAHPNVCIFARPHFASIYIGKRTLTPAYRAIMTCRIFDIICVQWFLSTYLHWGIMHTGSLCAYWLMVLHLNEFHHFRSGWLTDKMTLVY